MSELQRATVTFVGDSENQPTWDSLSAKTPHLKFVPT